MVLDINFAGAMGPVGFRFTGQAAGTNLYFSPPEGTPGSGPVFLNITTFRNTAALTVPPGGSGAGPLYAVLLFPVLGLVVASLSKQNRKKTRLRLIMTLSGLALLLALAGCGGRADNG